MCPDCTAPELNKDNTPAGTHVSGVWRSWIVYYCTPNTQTYFCCSTRSLSSSACLLSSSSLLSLSSSSSLRRSSSCLSRSLSSSSCRCRSSSSFLKERNGWSLIHLMLHPQLINICLQTLWQRRHLTFSSPALLFQFYVRWHKEQRGYSTCSAVWQTPPWLPPFPCCPRRPTLSCTQSKIGDK